MEKRNHNALWGESVGKEVNTFISLDTLDFALEAATKKKLNAEIQASDSEYQYARMFMIFDVKADGTLKARLVIGGHMTNPREEIDCYSSMMRQESSRILMLIADANGYEVGVGDIINAYLNATTKEKIWTTAGPEFVECGFVNSVGTKARVVKVQYGLKSSGHQFWEMLSDILASLGFCRTRGDPDVWIRANGAHCYDYVGTHVDDILVICKSSEAIVDELRSHFKFKTTTKPIFHLGVDYHHLEGKGHTN